MKREVDLMEFRKYYGQVDVVETDKIYEVESTAGVSFVMPKEFHLFVDGILLSPIEALVDLTLDMRTALFGDAEGVDTPVCLKYLFGKFVANGDERKFYTVDPMKDTEEQMTDVIIEAEWDAKQGVSNCNWISEVQKKWGMCVKHQLTEAEDRYEMLGKQFWVISLSDCTDPSMLRARRRFLENRKRLIVESDKILQEFEENKAKYRAMMAQLMARLHESTPCVVWQDADQTFVSKEVEVCGKKCTETVDYRHDKLGWMELTARLEKEEYELKFKEAVQKIRQHSMEVTRLEDGSGICVRKIQPPGKFKVGEFKFSKMGWEELCAKLDFLVAD